MKIVKYTYEQAIDICEKALDLLDIKEFLISKEEVRNIMIDIEDYLDTRRYFYYDTREIDNFMSNYPEIFGENYEIFNYMTDDEFIDYCKKRYPNIRWGNEVIERHWVI